MIRFAFGEYLRPQLISPNPRQSAQQDIDFLARFFTSERGTTYSVSLISNAPGPPRRWSALLEGQSGELTVAVERQELNDDDFRQAQARLLSKGTIAKQGLDQVNKLELAAILRESVMTKLDANSLLATEAAERVLLLRNRVEGTNESTYLATGISFRSMPIEYGYMIARGRLLELWRPGTMT